MDARARQLLEKLLRDGDKADAGVRSRAPALTQSNLEPYRRERSLQAKESFETTMQAAQSEGAVCLSWDSPQEGNGFIERVNLVDSRALAAFLGQKLLDDVLSEAASQFAPHMKCFPVLDDVLRRWAQLRTVRSLKPASVQDWLDAIKVIDSARETTVSNAISVPIREVSSRLFKDSKRIEKLVAPADVLLCGSVEAKPREPVAVWEELGLYREERPVLLAGNVIVARERVTAYLDTPYVGLPAVTVQGLGSIPHQVMTIENMTTFHSEAKRRCNEKVLLIYTAGMPSPAWRSMYIRLLLKLPETTPVFHWGDVDEGGFRIAATLAREAQTVGHKLQPWKMHPDNVPDDVRRKTTPYVLERIRYFAAAAGWAELGDAVAEAGFTVEQEGVG
ncbi:MAG: DUF2220 family protein [Betaproteobacteria bacterium]|nr:DUF2220 family protein [Betaproteobacteria bacterium]